MKYIKNCLKIILTTVIILLITSTLSYFEIIKDSLIRNRIIFLLVILIYSYLLGKKANKKGYYEGIKQGLCLTSILIVTGLLLKKNILNNIVYYILVFLMSIVGCILGINRKEKTH